MTKSFCQSCARWALGSARKKIYPCAEVSDFGVVKEQKLNSPNIKFQKSTMYRTGEIMCLTTIIAPNPLALFPSTCQLTSQKSAWCHLFIPPGSNVTLRNKHQFFQFIDLIAHSSGMFKFKIGCMFMHLPFELFELS